MHSPEPIPMHFIQCEMGFLIPSQIFYKKPSYPTKDSTLHRPDLPSTRRPQPDATTPNFLQRSLSLPITNCSANLIRGAALGASRQQLAAGLAHVVFLLHDRKLLILGKRQGERHAEEEGRCGDDPCAFAAEAEDAPGLAGD